MIVIAVGYVISHPLVFNLCSNMYQFNNYPGCSDDSIKSLGLPLFFFALYFLPLAIVLAFVPRNIFNSWLKLALWAIPLSIIFIAVTPVNSNAFMDFFPFYRDDAARLAAEVFTAISLVLIIWRALRSARAE